MDRSTWKMTRMRRAWNNLHHTTITIMLSANEEENLVDGSSKTGKRVEKG